MIKKYDNLFSPITIGTMKLKNRIVLAPMSVHITPPDGSITDREIIFYKRKAEGGTGLITIGSVLIRADGNFGGQIFIDNDSRIPGLKRMADAIHQADAKISAQIHHSGRETNIATCGYQPVSASVFEPETAEYDLPRALTTREVGDYVEYYAQGIRRAKEAGFDAVELHCAHGYLIAQFMSPLTNFRADQYGGSFLGRMRFIKEIFERARELVGDDFTITVRISGDELRPNGIDMHLSREIAKYLEKLGAAAISVSAQMYPYVRTCPNMYHKPGINVYLAENIKDVVKVPVMTAGRINTPELAEEILSSGKADLVCLGRVLLADPDFSKKAQEGRPEEIITCIACNKGCHDRNAEDRAVKCTMNPETGREGTFEILPAKESKKVLIVGGGPAGMEAARVATLRGHDVELYDRNEELGGRLLLATVPPNKTGYLEGIEFLKREIERLKIKVNLGTCLNKEEIEKKNPDAVILATGARTMIPGIEGIEQF
ncbi:NADH oxidase [subsurface metagenome]